ncbi:MAG: replication-associated recombination protein A [Thermacetogeniaceae bacterium]
MDLFDYAQQRASEHEGPLAYRMRPRTIEEFAGQDHLVVPGRPLHSALKADNPFSAVFFGPPGTGKTSLAGIIARETNGFFIQIDATSTGVGELRRILQDARDRLKLYNQKTILFIDELHRFNKAQQDVLLPAVEQGTVILIGATTENPYFSINSPLLSRTRVLPFYPLKAEDLHKILDRALSDSERGLGKLKLDISPEAREHWVRVSGGDARILLNALEVAVQLTEPGADGVISIGLDEAAAAVQQTPVVYDHDGDQHYDVISAFIKSMRGSDPDAVLHWLARMLKAGEDPRFIARRIVIHAAEDVGLADPMVLVVAEAAARAVEHVGMPEGRLILAEAALYVACAPKSNSVYKGIEKALQDVEKGAIGVVPNHLRDSSYSGAKKLGHGKGYLYPHNFKGNYVQQQYLPDTLIGRKYYEPSESGREKQIKRWLEFLQSQNKKE